MIRRGSSKRRAGHHCSVEERIYTVVGRIDDVVTHDRYVDPLHFVFAPPQYTTFGHQCCLEVVLYHHVPHQNDSLAPLFHVEGQGGSLVVLRNKLFYDNKIKLAVLFAVTDLMTTLRFVNIVMRPIVVAESFLNRIGLAINLAMRSAVCAMTFLVKALRSLKIRQQGDSNNLNRQDQSALKTKKTSFVIYLISSKTC